jgi:hypothetical protein
MTMWVNGRRIDYRRSWQIAREQFAAIVAERDQLRHDLDNVRRQRDDAIAALIDLRAARGRVETATVELRELYRAREIQRAQAVERDPTRPLQ